MRRHGGFTLVELLAGIAIVAVLAVLIASAYKNILNSSGAARCVTNMRSLHASFAAYISDNDHWPQQPEFEPDEDEAYGEWWITTMHPYVQSDSIWICPTLQSFGRMNPSSNQMRINYTPTLFDAFRNRPYQWPNMPWLIEAGNAHGKGANVLFPDGSVRTYSDLLDSYQNAQ
ncbi:MAG TPA: type II secretion system protein [Chthoniobacterales bacterium]